MPNLPVVQFRAEHQSFPLAGEKVHQHPEPGVMWVFLNGEEPEAVEYMCPCGCGHHIYMNLNLQHPHRWQYRLDANGPTLTPSVRWTSGCKAHFNITDGRVVWHSDSGK